MREVSARVGRLEVIYQSLTRPFDFVSPFEGEEFAAMLWATQAVTAAERLHFSTQLVNQRCRYAVCGGVDCEEWYDAIDEVRPDDPLVITTLHEGQSTNDVARFSAKHACWDESEPVRFVVLTIGTGTALIESARKAVSRCFRTSRNS